MKTSEIPHTSDLSPLPPPPLPAQLLHEAVKEDEAKKAAAAASKNSGVASGLLSKLRGKG